MGLGPRSSSVSNPISRNLELWAPTSEPLPQSCTQTIRVWALVNFRIAALESACASPQYAIRTRRGATLPKHCHVQPVIFHLRYNIYTCPLTEIRDLLFGTSSIIDITNCHTGRYVFPITSIQDSLNLSSLSRPRLCRYFGDPRARGRLGGYKTRPYTFGRPARGVAFGRPRAIFYLASRIQTAFCAHYFKP